MYNNDFNYYLKSILGKKNDAWYFDRLQKSFAKSNRNLTNDILGWAQNAESSEKKLLSEGFIINPIYEEAQKLRDTLLSNYQNKFSNQSIQILLHTPPSNFSPGGFSWFRNLGAALTYCGIDVIYFWDDIKTIELDITKRILIFTSHDTNYTKHIDLNWLNNKRTKYQIEFRLSTNFESISISVVSAIA